MNTKTKVVVLGGLVGAALGVVAALIGLAIGVVSLALGVRGWTIERLWFYLLGSAMAMILGLQLVVFGVMTRVLAELSHRESQIDLDLAGKPCELRAATAPEAQPAELPLGA